MTCRVLSYQEPGWRLPDFEQAAAQRAEAAAFWREVILLAVGYLVHQNRDLGKPRLLVEELCPDRSPPTDSAWRQVWLAGEVLLEVGLNRIQDSAHGKGLLERVRRRLTELVETGALSARERAEAGDVLGQLDDPRFDPTRFYLPCTYRGQPEPLAGFVEIPPGPFVMGGPEDDPEDFMKNESGNPAQLTIDYPYWIAQYPVTVGQFQCFVEADGYKEQRWWTRIGWNWRNGNWFSESLGKMPRELHKEPKYWKTQLNYPNRPVVGITWFEAVAYCCWLNTQMRTTNLLTLTLEEGYVIRLPTEAEWEKAARCSGSRRYPWGNENWDLERANIKASGIDHATVVGLYRKGVTPTGLHDVSGNVWERTLSLNLRYPYDPQDGRNNLEAGGSRIVRGGCFFFDESCGRCTFRDWKPIDYFDSHGGFRVVLSLANSEF